MLVTALVLFIIGALGGVVMARQILDGQSPSPAIAILHGLANGIGLILLIIAAVTRVIPDAAMTALVLFIITASGGLYLVSFHLRGKPHPRWMVLGHASIAAASSSRWRSRCSSFQQKQAGKGNNADETGMRCCAGRCTLAGHSNVSRP